MGQKIHPKACRLGYIQDWDSRWFSLREMPSLLKEDFEIRRLIRQRLLQAAVSKIVIERAGSYLRVNIHTAKPGIVIGKKGADIEGIRENLENLTSRKVIVNVIEVKQPELDAQLVSESVAYQLVKRIHHRRAMKRAIERSLGAGALGVKIKVSGRLGGAEIARREWLREGRVPLHTFRADIDYGFSEAATTMGRIGVKVWIFKKEYFFKSREELLSQVRKQERGPVPEVKPASVPEGAAGKDTPSSEGGPASPAGGRFPLPEGAEPSPAAASVTPPPASGRMPVFGQAGGGVTTAGEKKQAVTTEPASPAQGKGTDHVDA